MKTKPNPTRRIHGRRGFTLVEMLLVLVILGTLAALVIPKLTGRAEDARKTTAHADIAGIGSALDMFEVDVGEYPKGKEGLVALFEEPTGALGWHGPYLKKTELPKDPWGNYYAYEYPGRNNPTGYDLYSFGPDKKEGTDDDIVNWSTQ